MRLTGPVNPGTPPFGEPECHSRLDAAKTMMVSARPRVSCGCGQENVCFLLLLLCFGVQHGHDWAKTHMPKSIKADVFLLHLQQDRLLVNTKKQNRPPQWFANPALARDVKNALELIAQVSQGWGIAFRPSRRAAGALCRPGFESCVCVLLTSNPVFSYSFFFFFCQERGGTSGCVGKKEALGCVVRQ